MVNLPMMGGAGMQNQTSYFPPAPRGNVGGLGGLGGFINSRRGGDVMQALGISLMGGPRNAPLQDFGQNLMALQDRTRGSEKEAAAQAQAAEQRQAMVSAAVAYGVPQDEAQALSANPQALKMRVEQIAGEQAATQRNEFLTSLGAPGSFDMPAAPGGQAAAPQGGTDSWGALGAQYGWQAPTQGEATGDFIEPTQAAQAAPSPQQSAPQAAPQFSTQNPNAEKLMQQRQQYVQRMMAAPDEASRKVLENYIGQIDKMMEHYKPTDTQTNLQWRAREAGIHPGTPEYKAFMASGGSSADEGAAVQRIGRIAENLMATGDFVDPQQAHNIAVGIVDGRLKADRHPVTGELQVVDMATGRPAYQPSGAGAAQSLPSPADPMSSTDQFGQQFPASNEAFGVPGAVASGINRVTDAIGVGPAYPEIQQTQADFGVLRESLLNDMASAYNRQPPSWLLREIRDLTPAAGSPFEGAAGAQSKMNAIGRHLTNELAATESALERELTPTNRQELEARRAGLQMGIDRVKGALGSFQQPSKPSGSAGAFRDGQTATNPETGARVIYRGGKWEPVQ